MHTILGINIQQISNYIFIQRKLIQANSQFNIYHGRLVVICKGGDEDNKRWTKPEQHQYN